MRETQYTISDWAQSTFGPVGSDIMVASRANEELAELIKVLVVNPSDPSAVEEAADVAIVLYRLATRLGYHVGDLSDLASPEGEPSVLALALKANHHMATVMYYLSSFSRPNLITSMELRDLYICLYRIAAMYGKSLPEEIDRKMEINRARVWALDGHGQGYHVKT